MTLHSCQSKLCLAESGSMQPHEGFCLCTTVPVGRRSHSEWPLLQVHLSSVSGVGIGTEAVMISFASNLMISISSIIFSFCSLVCPSKRFSDGRHFSVERNDKRTAFYGFSDISAYFYHHSISHRKCKVFLPKTPLCIVGANCVRLAVTGRIFPVFRQIRKRRVGRRTQCAPTSAGRNIFIIRRSCRIRLQQLLFGYSTVSSRLSETDAFSALTKAISSSPVMVSFTNRNSLISSSSARLSISSCLASL